MKVKLRFLTSQKNRSLYLTPAIYLMFGKKSPEYHIGLLIGIIWIKTEFNILFISKHMAKEVTK